MQRWQPPRGVVLLYGALGLGLWFVPLLNLLHAESAAVVAAVAFFAAGLSSLPRLAEGAPFGRAVVRQEGALLVPWLLLTVTLLWVPNCGYGQGLLFYLLFPVCSVVLAVALAYALAAARLRRPRVWFVAAGLAVALLGPLYDLGLHPQFYVYNHVFGGVLGPIYDEELAVRPGLFAFRGFTLLWAAVALCVGRWLHLRRGPTPAGARAAARALGAGVGTLLLLGTGYYFAGPLGINTPAPYLQAQLGAVHRTAHFDIYYDPAALTAEELRYLAADHEYHYARLATLLEVTVEERIASYLYPDPETKARLTGARLTNVAPVWLPTPQTHVLLGSYAEVFPHELAHVFSRTFGLPVLRASLAVGLVEGLAVALEPPEGRPSPHAQVAVALAAGVGVEGEEADRAAVLAARLSPQGFWTGRGAVSYTTMGSFVRFLLDTYGAAPLKAVYARGNFAAVYGKPVEVLVRAWLDFLEGRPLVPRATAGLVLHRFTQPSLFETRCPHYVPPYRRAYRAAVERLAAGDTTAAARLVAEALAEQPAYLPALDTWARLRLAAGDPAGVVARLDTLGVDTLSAALALRLADAYVLAERPAAAAAHYAAAYRLLPAYAREARSAVALRETLIENPAVVRILTSGWTLEGQAAALAAFAHPAVTWLRARRLAEAGHPAAAVRLLHAATVPEVTTPARRALLERQRPAWIAAYAARQGEAATAAAYAAAAARGFVAAGDLDAAAQLRALAARMQWLMQTDREYVL